MAARLVNLTPHEISIYGDDGGLLLSVLPSGTVARVTEKVTAEFTRDVAGATGPVPVRQVEAAEFAGIPEKEEGTVFIVSRVMADAHRAAVLAGYSPARHDIVCPGPAVRDEAGRQTGCTGLYWVQ